MTLKRTCLSLFLLLSFAYTNAQEEIFKTEMPFANNEYWWGAVVANGSLMPYIAPLGDFNLALENKNNQVSPLLISNKGRYVWSEKPFMFRVEDKSITIRSEYEFLPPKTSGTTLREAYLAASQKYFPASGELPNELFFTMPQYNTWIELMYDQNQEDILKYAQSVLDNGFPPGVLMIDDNWQQSYGNFDFRTDKFMYPKGMIDKLHAMGFKVMLWICPFVSADTKEYRDLAQKGYLLKKKGTDTPAIVEWWNGQSACYDLTNPHAFSHYVSILKRMQEEYGVDGFKLDAGDNNFYNPKLIDSHQKDALSVDHTMAWARVGLEFPFNEYRAGWRMGGEALVQRLGDKDYSWDAVQALVPDMIAAGLLGYAYTCPDMIGGGQFTAFLDKKDTDFNQTLIVRSAQVHALMPMMQFSVAPWRILDERHLKITQNMARLHQQFGGYILEQAQKSAISGEPIVRHMEYMFPNEGFELCKDQFMLGDKYLVAPVVTAKNRRSIKLPAGEWQDDLGKIYEGGRTLTIDVPLERLVYFEKL